MTVEVGITKTKEMAHANDSKILSLTVFVLFSCLKAAKF